MHAAEACMSVNWLKSHQQSMLEEAIFFYAPIFMRSPRFGIGHAMCLGLAPWMAAEIPHMADNGVISNEA